MQHEIWLGPAGSGKTHALIQRYLQVLSKTTHEKPVFFVVPTHEHAERIRNLLLKESGKAGLFSPNVFTFNELMEKLAGPQKRGDISNALRAQWLREVLRDTASRLQVFKAVADLPGFLNVLVHVIGEFEILELVGPRAVKKLTALGVSELTGMKLADLELICAGYFAKLKAAGLFSQTELYLRWAQRLEKRSDVLAGISGIYFDGFFDLNPVQKKWLQILNQNHIEIIFTLTAQKSLRTELFEFPLETFTFLKELKFSVQEFSKPQRFLNEDLKHLEQNLFMESPAFAVPAQNVSLLKPLSPRYEIKLMTQSIRKLIQDDSSLRFSDICVIYHDLAFVRSDLITIFQEYSLPAHVHERMWFKDIPLIRFLMGILAIFQNNWQAKDVAGYLKSDFLNLTLEQKANLELKLMLSPSQPGLELADQPLIDLWQALQAASSAWETGERLKKFLHQTIFATNDLLNSDALDVFAFEELSRTFKDVESYFETGFEIQKYIAYLETAIEIHLVSLPAPEQDAVQIYTVSLARQKEYRIVLVAGLIEKQFPRQIFENPIFSDEERAQIHPQLSLAAKRRRHEKYLYYLALTRAREKLFLSYPQYNEEGQQTLPSFFLQQTLQLFEEKIPKIHQDYLGNRTDALPAKASDYQLLTVDALKHGKTFPLKIKNLEADLFQKFQQVSADELKVDLKQIPASFFENGFSPSRLNDLSQCAYRYFAKHDLNLETRPDWVARQNQARGNFFHDVLYAFYSGLVKIPSWEKWGTLQLQDQMQKVFDETLQAEDHAWLQNSKLAIRLQRSKIQKKLNEFIETDHMRLITRGLKPLLLEFDLDTTLKTQHLNLNLHGRVDRVDQSPDGQYLLRDYKTGREFKSDQVKIGLALQIPTYLYLLSKKYGNHKILGGEIYAINSDKANGLYHTSAKEILDDLAGRRIIFMDQENFEKHLASFEKYVEELVHTRRNQGVVVHPKTCEFCEFSGLCRYQTWMHKYLTQEKLPEVIHVV